jgi:DNA-binding response OmpR family regulator
MSPSDAPRVLVTERDPSIRSLLAAVVNHMHFEAVVASDADAAVALLGMHKVIAAIVDPVNDARGVISRLTAADPSLAGRIIVVTTLPRETAENCAGVACVLRKPFPLDGLQEALRSVCRK